MSDFAIASSLLFRHPLALVATVIPLVSLVR